MPPLVQADFSRVPCVGEQISIADSEGNGDTYKVEWVNWEVMTNNAKPVKARISLDLDNSDNWFQDWYSNS
ncbi:MAG: hypothetical protein MI976_11190 [Pseudomonadales bacterium]|nr:hypothetical protein [Pseudomonadales bacterium]